MMHCQQSILVLGVKLCLTFIAQQAPPVLLAAALPRLCAGPVDAARVRDALIAERTLPSVVTPGRHKEQRSVWVDSRPNTALRPYTWAEAPLMVIHQTSNKRLSRDVLTKLSTDFCGLILEERHIPRRQRLSLFPCRVARGEVTERRPVKG